MSTNDEGLNIVESAGSPLVAEGINTVVPTPTSSTQRSETQPTVGVEGVETSQQPEVTEEKEKRERSFVWGHVTKFTTRKNEKKVRCNFCRKSEYKYDPSGSGTTAIRKHLFKCPKGPYSNAVKPAKSAAADDQSLLTFSSSNESVLTTWKFNQNRCRNALAHMIIVDEKPFKMVEGKGFRHFCNELQPKFVIPSRVTVARDCYELFVGERLKLKSSISFNCRKVCLTTDTWTSNQRINYMCLTAHYIDLNWKLQKRILNFCPISSHRGEFIGKLIEKCLLEWGIDKVMTVTVDNASSNDVAVQYLKKRVNHWKGSVLDGEFMHMRCVAHIMNLVVSDGLKLATPSIIRVRNTVRYLRQSPLRLEKFKACVVEERLGCDAMLCLDVCTRWNSTYLMLETALKLQSAFDRYVGLDFNFLSEVGHDEELDCRKGIPTEEDWVHIKNMVNFLKCFYTLTLSVSGTKYTTSNICLNKVSEVDFRLKHMCNNVDFEVAEMALQMKKKCDKYWGDAVKINVMLFIAVVLDPRYKLGYVNYVINNMYELSKAVVLVEKVRRKLFALFDEYERETYKSNTDVVGEASPSIDVDLVEGSLDLDVIDGRYGSAACVYEYKYRKELAQQVGGPRKSELDRYLEEETIAANSDTFDILEWWKVNSVRFPTVSLIARDVLAIQTSTVASESAFSCGGRILDDFRSSLSAKIVESLICTQDWLRAPTYEYHCMTEETLKEVDELEKAFEDIKFAPSVVDIIS